MQLNEVIEENSIATISKRTRISVENIERLVHRDFSKMKRVKALGFISILEREFSIELDTLKQECTEYFSSFPDEEFNAKLVVSVPESDERIGGWTSKLFMLLILFGIGYGAWYFLVDKEERQENNTTVSNTSFIGSIVNQAQAWLGNSSPLGEDNVSVSTEGIWAQKDTQKNMTGSGTQSDKTHMMPDEAKSIDEQNDSKAEEQIIKEVKQEQKEMIAEETKAPKTDGLTIESIIGNDTLDNTTEMTTTDDLPAIAEPEDVLAVEVPSMADATNTDEIVAIETKSVPKVQENKKSATKSEKKPVKKAKGKKVITFHPLKKVWVGYTDLSTMKRAAKVVEEDITFDTAVSSWILVAGHNAVNFVIKGKAITPKKREKNYFLLKKGKVKDISQEEFQKLNKSTVW